MKKENENSALFEWLYTTFTFFECGLITDYLPEEIYGFIFVDCKEECSKKDLVSLNKDELSEYKEIFSYDVKIADVFTKRGLRIVRKNGIRYRKAVGCVGLITLWDLCEFLESFANNAELNTKYLWRETQKISPFESGEIEPYGYECDEYENGDIKEIDKKCREKVIFGYDEWQAGRLKSRNNK